MRSRCTYLKLCEYINDAPWDDEYRVVEHENTSGRGGKWAWWGRCRGKERIWNEVLVILPLRSRKRLRSSRGSHRPEGPRHRCLVRGRRSNAAARRNAALSSEPGGGRLPETHSKQKPAHFRTDSWRTVIRMKRDVKWVFHTRRDVIFRRSLLPVLSRPQHLLQQFPLRPQC